MPAILADSVRLTTPNARALVAIVDPYSSGHGFAPAFRNAGVNAIAIRTAFSLPAIASATWEPGHFAHVLDGCAPFERLVDMVQALGPVGVVPGTDSGIELAEALTDRLFPGTGNDPALAPARRDKWETYRALVAADVPRLEQVCAADASEVDAWLDATGLHGAPLVLKPPRSAGADSVYIVRPGQDWRPVFDSLLGDVNKMGLRNEGVLVQEFADGVEYAVDTYSVGGRHTLALVCRYRKREVGDRLGIYEAVEFLPADNPQINSLFHYVRRVLGAVGLANGAAHVEVMETPRGLRLIEVNCRIAGGRQQVLQRVATGDSQIDRHVRHVAHGGFGPDVYRLRKHLTLIYLSSPAAGVWHNAELLAEAEALPTHHSTHVAWRTGDRVPQTLDIFSSLGQIVLAGSSAAAVEADVVAVRAIEARFDVRPQGV